MQKIWLAGGCFWGVEAYFQQLKGVADTCVGYGQGHTVRPTYQAVCTGITGHTEICEVTYDPQQLSLQQILEHYLRIVDPTTLNRQGPDQGTQYRTGIYYADPAEGEIVSSFLQERQGQYSQPIVVEVEPLRSFSRAEDYHQRYLQKNPGGYCHVDLHLIRPAERN